MSLDALFNPESIAIVGASRNEEKLGYIITDMITRFGYQGKLYLINPKADNILGMHTYPSVADTKAKIDLAITLVPANLIPPVAKECGEAGVKALIVITSGFRETGEEGTRLQDELKTIGEQFAMRIMGPNCEGFVNCYSSLFAVPFRTMFKDNSRPGPVSVISQSGCVTGLVYKRIQEQGIGISIAASVGNEVDLKAIDYLAYLAKEPNTKVISAFIEGIREGKKFKDLMKGITRSKPVVILKAGRSEASKAAALSHTGALVGRDEIVSSVFKQCGIIRANTVDELIDISLAFASQPILKGKGIGIVTTGGGLGVHTTDLCSQSGFVVPDLSRETETRIDKLIGSYGSARNPVDLGTRFSTQTPAEVTEILAGDAKIDAIIFILTAFPQMQIAENLLAAKRRLSKPLLLTWTAGKSAGEAYDHFINNGFPVFSSPCRVLNALNGMREYSEYLGED